ncbi:thioesterase family protein [Pimelobacter sp. 30-1]|uniref:acyl-CoA thioesterase n=1 Tax=Pimelobacter sp. 30-1 TaxID=2004991 RepID=UPI001C0485CE|nr:thioesterase family protein [Pimelobacter sp. 30-1]
MNGTHRGRVEWIDTDSAGIHHNTAIARYVESAEAALMRGLGLDGYFPVAPRVRYEVDFEAPLRFGDEVTATVHVERLGTSSLTLAFEVWGGPEGTPAVRAARGRYVTVHLDRASGTASPWPEAWRSRLGGSA